VLSSFTFIGTPTYTCARTRAHTHTHTHPHTHTHTHTHAHKPHRYVTFANLNRGSGDTSLAGYKFRATCLSDEELLCPRPLPDRDECSSNAAEQRGVCVEVRD